MIYWLNINSMLNSENISIYNWLGPRYRKTDPKFRPIVIINMIPNGLKPIAMDFKVVLEDF